MIYTLNQQNEIWQNYFPGFALGKFHLNPLRLDKSPKCYFKENSGIISFIDWAYIPTHINCIEYVSISFNLDFRNAISKINVDLKYNQINKVKMTFDGLIKSKIKTGIEISQSNITDFHKPIFDVKLKSEVSDYELEYWSQYNINLDLLNKYEIKPVEYVYKDNVLEYSASKFNPIFAYYDNNKLIKIYNPLGPKYLKWRTLEATLEGFSKLPYKSNVLFITSSLKDSLTLISLGFEAMNLPSENSYKILLPIIEDLFNKYEYIYVYLNNDHTGKSYSRLLTLEINTNFKYINNPSFMKETDPSDVIKYLGKNVLLDIIHEKLKRDNIKINDKEEKSKN